MRMLIPALLVAGLLVACSSDPADEPGVAPAEAPSAEVEVGFDAPLRDELLAMLERDQGRGDQSLGETGDDRQERLQEIFDEHGWPGFDLVGRRAGTAAWAIAQHADLDPEFQAAALELLRTAVAEGQASPGNLAYLDDRVAVAAGEPQTYGTQIRCGPDGPVAATPIRDRGGVEQRRADAGLDPLSDYLAEMTALCAQDSG